MDKMCTIQTLKDNGYTASGVISGTDPLKCIKVKDFKSFFSKPNTSLSVKDRTDNRLFPLKDIVEIDTTPSIKFGQDEYNIYYPASSLTNTFTAKNITGLTAIVEKTGTMGMTGGATVQLLEDNGKIIVNVPKNEFVAIDQYIVTISGNRVDGQTGVTSFSFTINQGFQLIYVVFNMAVGRIMEFTNDDGITYTTSTPTTAGETTYLMPYGTNTLKNYPSGLINHNGTIVGASGTWKVKAKDGTKFYYQVLGYNDYTNPLVDWTETSLFELKFTDYKQYDNYQKPFYIWLSSTPNNLYK